jgi:uncharacterized protein
MKTVFVVTVAALAFFALDPAARAQSAAPQAQTPQAQTPQAQTPQAQPAPSPEALAAAHDLMVIVKPEERFKLMLPVIMQNLKPAVVQGRPEVEKQFDATMPLLLDNAQKRVDDLANTIATIYASNFTPQELRDLIAFYLTPTGKKLLERQNVIAQQSMAAGQELGRAVVRDVQEQMQIKDQAK